MAVAGPDYEPISSHLTFPTGSVAGDMLCVNISIVNDVLFEGDETFTVLLTVNTAGVSEGNAVTIVTIRDDDCKLFCVVIFIVWIFSTYQIQVLIQIRRSTWLPHYFYL